MCNESLQLVCLLFEIKSALIWWAVFRSRNYQTAARLYALKQTIWFSECEAVRPSTALFVCIVSQLNHQKNNPSFSLTFFSISN